MLFWIAVILMLCTVVAIVVWPLIREQQDSREEADFDIEVFRDQLAEVVREHNEGRLEYAEAEAAKAEISRRRRPQIPPAGSSRTQYRANRRLLLHSRILIGSAVSAYLYTGSPGRHRAHLPNGPRSVNSTPNGRIAVEWIWRALRTL